MLYLHVGLHKTGTTYLQSAVFKNWNSVHYLRNLTIENFLRIDPQDTVLVSREGFSGPALGHQHEKIAFLKRLSRMFPDARILISFRSHSSYVNALYSQYLRYGGTLTLPDFFDVESDQGLLHKDDISFRPYIEAIQAYWGQLPFVFLLPEIMQRPEQLATDLGTVTGGRPPSFGAATRTSRNPSLRAPQAEFLRRVNVLCGVQFHRDGTTRPYRLLRRLSLDPPELCQRWTAFSRGPSAMDGATAQLIDQIFEDDWLFVQQCANHRLSESAR